MALELGDKSVIQKLPDLVEWYLQTKDIRLRFVPNNNRKGVINPDFDFEYWSDGRRISERALAMRIITTLCELDYAYSLARVISALTEHSWRYFISNQEYPPWLTLEPIIKRPRGRPRIHPPTEIKVPAVNTVAEESLHDR